MSKKHTLVKKHNILMDEFNSVKKYIKFYKNCSPEEHSALATYKTSSYLINKYLLDGDIKSINKNFLKDVLKISTTLLKYININLDTIDEFIEYYSPEEELWNEYKDIMKEEDFKTIYNKCIEEYKAI